VERLDALNRIASSTVVRGEPKIREGNGLNTTYTELKTRFRQKAPQVFPGLWLRSDLNQNPRAKRVARTAPADLM